jgi:hypothetical protein
MKKLGLNIEKFETIVSTSNNTFNDQFCSDKICNNICKKFIIEGVM